MRFLLDTNVVSEVSRPQPDARVVDWMAEKSPIDLAISVLTLGEIAKGVALLPAGSRRRRLEEWLTTGLQRQFLSRILPVDASVTLAWGKLAAEGRAAGRELPVIDGLLLATASARGLTLVTRNERDCADRGVSILNPWTL
jgi:toxin FitB